MKFDRMSCFLIGFCVGGIVTSWILDILVNEVVEDTDEKQSEVSHNKDNDNKVQVVESDIAKPHKPPQKILDDNNFIVYNKLYDKRVNTEVTIDDLDDHPVDSDEDEPEDEGEKDDIVDDIRLADEATWYENKFINQDLQDRRKNAGEPYIIDASTYSEAFPVYEKIDLKYFTEDGTLIDDHDEIVDNEDQLLGHTMDAVREATRLENRIPRVVYIRNDAWSTDFEVTVLQNDWLSWNGGV